MSERPLTILNISLDRGLLDPLYRNEAQIRQLFYCQKLPARIVHLVKAPKETARDRLNIAKDMSVVPCPVSHWSLFVPHAFRLGAKLLKEEHFDIIQVQEPYLAGLIGAVLSAKYKVPLIVGLFSDEIDNPLWLSERPLNHVANWVAKCVLRRARAARSDSQAVATRVRAGKYCPLITYIPFLITHAETLMQPHPEAVVVREQLLAGKHGPLLLAVNRLEPEKNISLMLQAMATLVRRNPEAVLAIAGTGLLADALHKEAEALIPHNVCWLGWVPAAEMGSYYHAADLLLISSNRESAARVLSESLLCGTPVLSTDTAGAREVIEDGLSSAIVPVGNVAAFSTALIDLASNPDKLNRMGRSGFDDIKSRMTGEAVVSTLRAFYHLALGRKT